MGDGEGAGLPVGTSDGLLELGIDVGDGDGAGEPVGADVGVAVGTKL